MPPDILLPSPEHRGNLKLSIVFFSELKTLLRRFDRLVKRELKKHKDTDLKVDPGYREAVLKPPKDLKVFRLIWIEYGAAEPQTWSAVEPYSIDYTLLNRSLVFSLTIVAFIYLC